ncbi:MAG: DsbA family protein [Candidatus Binatia bacterium]
MKADRKRLGLFLVAVGFLGGVAAATAALAADASYQQIVDYYRRKSNLPPDVTATVIEVKEAAIPGAKTATLQLGKGGQTQNVQVLMSPDGRYVVFGEVEDVTSDPFKAIAAKIKTDGNPVRGPKDAKVTIVEYSDFQCPYCARAHQTISDQVMKEYDGKVKLVYKNFPLGFHKWAEPAGVAGECAFEQDPDAFWKLYDFMFDNQQQITPENVKAKSEEALKGTKVDMAKWNDCYDNKKTLEKVKADMAEGQSVGVTGTPAFLINGRKISGAQPFQNFKAVIDDELQRAGKS